MKFKKSIALLLAIAISVSMAACGKKEAAVSDENPYKGTPESDMITVDIISEPATINTMLIQDGISGDVLRLIMSGLVKLDKNDNVEPDLAESWTVSEDKRAYTFNLRKDAKWSNGEPVTANDYFFAWTNQLDKTTGSVFAYLIYENIKNGFEYYNGEVPVSELGVKVIDDYTLYVEFVQPTPYGLYLLSTASFQPIHQKTYEEIGADNYAKTPESIITTGAYLLKEWVHDDSILLEKNPDYYAADSIKIPRVKIVMIADQNTRLSAFKTGMLDVCNISGDQLDQVAQKNSQIIKKYEDSNTWFFRFNTKSEFLSNANIRRALGYSVDIQSLLDNVIKDGSVAADGIVPRSIIGADGQSYSEARGSLFAYNPEEAKKYLELGLSELGITADKLKIELLCSDSSYAKTQAEYTQQQWKTNLGIDVAIKSQPFKAGLVAEQQGDFDVSIVGWGPDYNDPMTFLSMFGSDNANNTGQYSNPEYDKLLDKIREEVDFEKRQEYIISLEKMLIDDMAIAPMYFTCTLYVSSAKISGLTRTGFQPIDLCDGAEIIAN